jgi:K+-transporting ATPase c subunit
MENISQILCMLITCGLYYPVTTAVIGGVYFLGRLIYTFGYIAGAKGRFLGVPFVMSV